jgi:hypothetical protein
MTGAEIIALTRKRGVAVEVFLGKLRVHGEGDRDESLVRLLCDNRQVVIDAFLEAETEPNRWRRLLAEKIETIVKMRGLPRPDAEAEAFRHIVIEYLNETLPGTDPRVCAHCRGPDLPLTPILPFGVGDRHTWLHQRCRDRWADRRRAEAVATLAGMGITETPLPQSSAISPRDSCSIMKGSDAVPAHRRAVGSDGNIAGTERRET